VLPRILHLALLLAPARPTEFVGSTPCAERALEFLGGLATDAPCMYVRWRILLSAERFDVSAAYFVPTRRNPNLDEPGPRTQRHGTWRAERGTRADPDAVVLRLDAAAPKRSLSFARLGGQLLHLLDGERGLVAGNGGWSYTLALAGADTLPHPRPHRGPAGDPAPPAAAPHAGVYDGRTPCQPLARQLGLGVPSDCFKMKWRLRLSDDSRYLLEFTGHRDPPRSGRYAVRSPREPWRGVVFELDPGAAGAFLALLKPDDDVLLFLGKDGEPLVGNADFGYTLNRQR
jgi:hypothetical protein